MKTNNWVAYYRVSTNKQGINGLGMDAQKESVRRLTAARGGGVIASYEEVETGKRGDRPELMKALEHCRKAGATLVIAKLDRLARNAAFVLGLRDSGVEFIACDMPEANRVTVGLLAVMAEHEREMISQRTKDALQAAKRRGTVLGNPRYGEALEVARARRAENAKAFAERVLPEIAEIRAAGVKSYHGIAKCLRARGIKTIGGKDFKAQTVVNLVRDGEIEPIS